MADLKAALDRIAYRFQPLDIVLLQTGADKRLGSPAYFDQPGLGRDGTLWLVEQGVRVIGIDAYTLDRPFASMVADYQRTGDGQLHLAGPLCRHHEGILSIENLANLDLIPQPHGFYVSCLPVKIKDASAGWCRAVAARAYVSVRRGNGPVHVLPPHLRSQQGQRPPDVGREQWRLRCSPAGGPEDPSKVSLPTALQSSAAAATFSAVLHPQRAKDLTS